MPTVKTTEEIFAEFGITMPASAASGQDLAYCATEQHLCTIGEDDDARVDAAVRKARATFESGVWRDKSAGERTATLYRISELLLENAEEFAALNTLETGSPIGQSRGMHVPRSAENFRFFGELLSAHAGETYSQTGGYLSVVTREPIGVGALIAPWNAPLVLSTMKLAACISLGNSIVVKPSEFAPLAVLRLVEIIKQAGVPDGVVEVVTGSGATTGAALVSHPEVDSIGFIGGTGTARKIMEAGAGTLKKVGLEAGGKSANIILDDAEYETALDGALLSIFANNGQQCLAGARILVQEGIADRFMADIAARTSALRVGDPFDPSSEVGPLAYKAHYDRVMGFADHAGSSAGYEVLAGGKRADGFDKGFFFQPTIVRVDSNTSRLCQEEIFAPFATLQVIKDLEEGVKIANQSEFGLVSYIWSNDMTSCMQASKAIRAGTVWVNTPMARDLRSPFGGYKQSGVGRDGLPGSIELFTEEKTTMLPYNKLTLPKLGLG